MEHWYPKRRFGDLYDEAAARWPDREALVYRDRRYTFAEAAAKVDEAARALIGLGVGPGEHVALWLTNCDEWVFVHFALAKIGAVTVPVNTRFRTRDLAYVLKQSDSAMLVAHDVSGPVDYLAMLRELDRADFPELREIVLVSEGPAHEGFADWRAALEAGRAVPQEELARRAADVEPDAVAFIMYTSGTTGFPKGAMHSHKLLRNNEERGFKLGFTVRDTVLNYLPLFHAFGYSEGALMSPLFGARQILTATFDPDECLDLVEAEGVTVMHGFEAHMKGLCEAQEARPRDLSSLRTGLFAAGMKSATPVCRRGAETLKPMRAVSGFGMTEVWLGVTVGSVDDGLERRTETSGYPAPGYETRIVDPETGAPCPPGAEGELQVRGFSLMLGYYKKPAETAESYTEDGWFRTGDMGLWREDGYMRFLGRYKDMLKVGGENVDPMEVEGLLLDHPEIRQAAVVGAPDARLAEVAAAYVELEPGSRLDAAAVAAWCRGKVASFKIPAHVFFIDEFPMTASGKIRKVDLRADAQKRIEQRADAQKRTEQRADAQKRTGLRADTSSRLETRGDMAAC